MHGTLGNTGLKCVQKEFYYYDVSPMSDFSTVLNLTMSEFSSDFFIR